MNMKKLILFLSTGMFGVFNIFAQTPYDNFAPEQSVKSIIELPQTQFRLENTNTNSEVRYAEFDKNTLSLILLDDSANVIKTLVFSPNEKKFLTMDPLAEKYYSISPYAYCANNPIRYVDLRGDSISLAGMQQLDQVLNTSYTQTIVSDLQAQTGLAIAVATDGKMSYTKDANGKPVIATTTDANGNTVLVGSAAARTLMTGAIDHQDWVTLAPGKSGVLPGTNNIGLNFKQINGFMSGTVGMDSRTLGWGMTFMHELHHTQVGGGLHDTPGNPGPVVTQMNIIRSELNTLGGNYGQRLNYNATPIGSFNYIPFNAGAQGLINARLIPGAMPNDKFIRYK